MGFLSRGWSLLALSQSIAYSWALSNTPTPGVTEVDLISPRNETYPPSPLTPFVIAIQNPSLLSSTHPRIFYDLVQYNSSSYNGVTGSIIDLPKINYTSSDPYFLYWSIDHLDNVEGTFMFAWELHMRNCTYDSESDSVTFGTFGQRNNQVHFSTKKGASPPDLAAATEPDACDDTQAQAVYVSDLQAVAPNEILSLPTGETWGASSCAAALETWPTPSPCRVKIDAPAAASISAALTSAACANPLRTGMSCPTPSAKNAASSRHFPLGGAWILAFTNTLLAYSLA
ncbi:hypothetical protein BDW42DRAFT_164249 [Aspergillus taichungensis]|uniref:DUF7136 domain-containing protein n=1 Tax=Aspergillus taichungensis TaxID=482145 RepID=A0A2J5I2C0_9EURO|nr:hypothetical protein BDW42DRAFT_164249 [Aspergillus taichungensis]